MGKFVELIQRRVFFCVGGEKEEAERAQAGSGAAEQEVHRERAQSPELPSQPKCDASL